MTPEVAHKSTWSKLAVAYGSALEVGLGVDFILLFSTALLLDGGRMLGSFQVPVIAHWATVALILARRPFSPTWCDLQLVRFGTLVLLVVTFLVAALLVRVP